MLERSIAITCNGGFSSSAMSQCNLCDSTSFLEVKLEAGECPERPWDLLKYSWTWLWKSCGVRRWHLWDRTEGWNEE